MPKVFRCADLGIECKWEGAADTEEELIQKVAEHAASEHEMNELTETMHIIIKSRIRDE